MSERPQCRFKHNELAVALVEMDQGCACYPEDREQWLCLQHLHESEPLGSWTIKEWA